MNVSWFVLSIHPFEVKFSLPLVGFRYSPSSKPLHFHFFLLAKINSVLVKVCLHQLPQSWLEPRRAMTRKYKGNNDEYQLEPESYKVHAIVNRRFNKELSRLEYLVQWVDYEEETWEPEAALYDQHLGTYCRLVDRWYVEATEDVPFFQFCKSLRRNNYIGASHDGRCAFHAVKLALCQLNNQAWYSESLVNAFYDKHLKAGVPIPGSGIPSWKLLRDFIYFGNQSCQPPAKQIFLKAFRNNYLTRTIPTAEELSNVDLADGSYICAAFNLQHVGHAFTISVSAGIKLASDQDTSDQPLVSFVKPWFFRALFLRRIELRMKA